MYTQFFRLNQAPFSIAPDPHYLFMSERHREALAHLLYGVGSGGGFVLLTGEIGAGKTTVCRCFLEQIPANCRVAYIFNPKLTVRELLKTICDEFHIDTLQPEAMAISAKTCVDALNASLLDSHAKGQNNLLIIDEAQSLSAEVLEQLRLLTNLETNERKLLQIILIGQPELRTMLADPALEQLAQRVIARYHLDSLSAAETARYVLHRLTIAGLTTAPPFSGRLLQRIHQLTKGVPRRINLLCDRALLGAYVEGKLVVDRHIIGKAASEVFGLQARGAFKDHQWRYLVAGLLGGMAISAAIAWRLTANRVDPVEKPVVAAFADKHVQVEAKKVPAVALPVIAAAVTSGQTAKADRPAEESGATRYSVVSSADEADAAYRALALLWGKPLQPGDLCQSAIKSNLHCYQSSNGLAELALLDWPAILTLRDAANMVYPALLLGLNKVSATVRIGGKDTILNLSELEKSFNGEFKTFWRAPRFFRDVIDSGDSGADVDWLAAQLAQWNNLPKLTAKQVFNQEIARQVRDFQAAQKLKVDGVAGPKTMMRLNIVTGVDEPRLQSNQTAKNALPGE